MSLLRENYQVRTTTRTTQHTVTSKVLQGGTITVKHSYLNRNNLSGNLTAKTKQIVQCILLWRIYTEQICSINTAKKYYNAKRIKKIKWNVWYFDNLYLIFCRCSFCVFFWRRLCLSTFTEKWPNLSLGLHWLQFDLQTKNNYCKYNVLLSLKSNMCFIYYGNV